MSWLVVIVWIIVIGGILLWDFIPKPLETKQVEKPEAELANKFQDTLNAYRALPESYQHGDLEAVLMGIQNSAGGSEEVVRHFTSAGGTYRSRHVSTCPRDECSVFPEWYKLNESIQQAAEEVETAKKAQLEFENRHSVEQAKFVLEGIKEEMKNSRELRQNLKELA